MKLGIDMDGVLANFESGFAPLLRGYKFNLNDPNFPEVWDWPQHHGVPDKVIDEAWRELEKDANFWYNLKPQPSAYADIDALRAARERGHDIYFITDRLGILAKHQTEGWLKLYGYGTPTVLVSGQKARCAKALKLDAYIDDRPSNLEGHPDKTKLFMFLRPYNVDYQAEERFIANNVAAVTNVRQMLNILEV